MNVVRGFIVHSGQLVRSVFPINWLVRCISHILISSFWQLMITRFSTCHVEWNISPRDGPFHVYPPRVGRNLRSLSEVGKWPATQDVQNLAKFGACESLQRTLITSSDHWLTDKNLDANSTSVIRRCKSLWTDTVATASQHIKLPNIPKKFHEYQRLH